MIFRNDDIYLTTSPRYGTTYYDFDKFKTSHELLKGQEHYLAIIAAEIDKYPELTEYILKHKKDFKFGVHGWTHEDYGRHTETYEHLKMAKEKIEKVFKTKVKWFFPPWNRWNNNTIEICKNLGLECNVIYTQPPDFKKADVVCFHYWNDEEIDFIKKWLTS